MDHIKDDFNLKEIPVQNLTYKSKYKPPSDWMTFHNFAREKGWVLSQDYQIRFVRDIESSQSLVVEKDLSVLLQAWLFFGLIFTVLQKEGKPILTYDDLLGEDKQYVTTEKLTEAIKEWQKWENRTPSGFQLRMIRVGRVLDIGRRVTRKNCSYTKGRPSPPKSSENRESVELSLMVLGETLSAAKAQILAQASLEFRGWHRDDGEGWGQPRYVWSKMESDGWCPRTIHLWQNQLRSHATLLLASYSAYQEGKWFKGPEHTGAPNRPRCDNNNCFVKPVDKDGKYQPAHAANCDKLCGEMKGPNMPIIRELLSEKPHAKIPLLEFGENPTEAGVIDLRIRSQTKNLEYATISHVWSDGFGNETDNKLYPCQLQFIWQQLHSLGMESYPFWMDTLVIPVAPEDQDIRQLALSQIFKVFRESSFTIVLDGGLNGMNPGKPGHAAMRILGSSWMRRLWTLQEAFLSNKIHFSFGEAHPDSRTEFMDVSANLEEFKHHHPTSLLGMVLDHLRYHIVDHERRKGRKYLKTNEAAPEGKQVASLIANIWRAAKWRTRSNPYHETLALASLLNLDYQDTEIGQAGLEQVNTKDQIALDDARQIEKMDSLMMQFWLQFNSRWPNSIPPGIIFLKGERIERRGFGWAPRTWLSADPIDAPDPLSIINSTAELNESNCDGLKVSYPGFLLESSNKKLLTFSTKQHSKFRFPTGPSLMDWYVVEPADDATNSAYLLSCMEDPMPLGIILSRPKPDAASAEIGLLVRIRKIQTPNHNNFSISHDVSSTVSSIDESQLYERNVDGGDSQRIFFCEIIRRVRVSRETQLKFHAANYGRYFEDYEALQSVSQIPEIMTNPETDNEICVAEELDNSQVWYVDGYFPNREQP